MSKRSSLFWGSVLIILAVLLLLKQAQIINDVFGFFWPLAIIALGIWLIIGYFTRNQRAEGKQVSIPLEGASSAYLKLDHGAGRLTMRSGASLEEVLHGTFGNGLDYHSRLEAGRLEVKLRTPRQFWVWLPGELMDWDMLLNPNIPMAIKLDSGASSSTLDLTDLKITSLDIETGASSTEVSLPAAAGNTHVSVGTGVSSLKINVPDGVAASIKVKSGISAVSINPRFTRFDGGLYQSPDYATAANRADIAINAGVGSIEIK
jgi:hypothetical protein